jgi:ElaB/YqjD/DUF883 family membrane-anchored ribosome-binding protein
MAAAAASVVERAVLRRANMNDVVTETRDLAASNLRRLVDGTEALLDALNKGGGDQYRQMTERIGKDIARAKEQLDELNDSMAARTRAIARRTDRVVRTHPWEVAGTAGATALLLGIAIGLLMGRSAQDRGDLP